MVPEIEGIGVLLLDPATGGGELWDFSEGGGFVPSGARSYRYVQYGTGDVAALLDTQTGLELDAMYEDEQLWLAKVGPGGDLAVGQAGDRVGLFSLPRLQLIALLESPPPASKRSYVESVEWSDDERSVAAIRGSGSTRLIDVVVDGVALHLGEAPGGALQWSWDGTRVAVTGEGGTMIYDAAEGDAIRIDADGWNPRWSPDDRYLAIAHPGNLDAVRVFASDDGAEVLRVTGAPVCVADYWYPDGTIAGGGPWLASTTVPGGEVALRKDGDFPGTPEQTAFGERHLIYDSDALRLVDGDGGVLAELRLPGGMLTSSPIGDEGAYPIAADGRGVVFVNRGGRGFCDGGWPEPAVYLPPFGEPGWEFAAAPTRMPR
jgi:hypothetical protein